MPEFRTLVGLWGSESPPVMLLPATEPLRPAATSSSAKRIERTGLASRPPPCVPLERTCSSRGWRSDPRLSWCACFIPLRRLPLRAMLARPFPFVRGLRELGCELSPAGSSEAQASSSSASEAEGERDLLVAEAEDVGVGGVDLEPELGLGAAEEEVLHLGDFSIEG